MKIMIIIECAEYYTRTTLDTLHTRFYIHRHLDFNWFAMPLSMLWNHFNANRIISAKKRINSSHTRLPKRLAYKIQLSTNKMNGTSISIVMSMNLPHSDHIHKSENCGEEKTTTNYNWTKKCFYEWKKKRRMGDWPQIL